jgi:hypothetical protein
MVISDLKIGMTLNCDGPGSIPVYDGKDGTGSILLNVAPGQLIGQIHDITTGPGGSVLWFASDAITQASPWYSKITGGLLETVDWVNPLWWLDNTAKETEWGQYGSVNFADLAANVTDAQVASQAAAMQAMADGGNGVSNKLSNIANGAGQAAGSAIKAALTGAIGAGGGTLIWGGLGLLGLFLLTRANIKTKGFSYGQRSRRPQSKAKKGFSFKY